MHDALFQQQEPEGAGRWNSRFMVDFGHRQGITGSRYDRCVLTGTYLGFIDRITQQAQQQGINATPTILINGRLVEDPAILFSPSAFEAAVNQAAQSPTR
jgi:protein-disulfide isomerase